MKLDRYNYWLSVAQKVSKTREETEDLLQDCLMIAFQKERLDFSVENNRKWFTGVLKRRGAMVVRTESRRRTREQGVENRLSIEQEPNESSYDDLKTRLLTNLPPGARRVMVLVLAGLNRDEVQSALNLSSTSLRQRLTTIRKHIRSLPDELHLEALAIAYQRRVNREEDFDFGLIRRALHRIVKGADGIGTHDPDGHPLIINSK